jgi:hypothetical protein
MRTEQNAEKEQSRSTRLFKRDSDLLTAIRSRSCTATEAEQTVCYMTAASDTATELTCGSCPRRTYHPVV